MCCWHSAVNCAQALSKYLQKFQRGETMERFIFDYRYLIAKEHSVNQKRTPEIIWVQSLAVIGPNETGVGQLYFIMCCDPTATFRMVKFFMM